MRIGAFVPWRVAQLLVDRGPAAAPGRGSGYLIAPGRVLTAAHVLRDAVTVTVVLDAGGGEVQVTVPTGSWWPEMDGDADPDLAVVTIPDDAHGERPCPIVPFGRVVDESGTLVVEAAGFPLFKLRRIGSPDVVARDTAHVFAQVSLASNRRDATWEVSVRSAAPSDAGMESPWAGFSGSAVWAGGVLVGVVVRHHQEEGIATLTATRIDRTLGRAVDGRAARWRDLLGLMHGSTGPGLVDVHAPGGSRFTSAYLRQLTSLAPDVLVDRASDLADMTAFAVADTVATPYRWYRADAWAGKSALFAWWMLHAPPGLDVLPYFVTSRRHSGADRSGFVDAMLAQLSEFLSDEYRMGVTAAVREPQMLDMLERAAQRSASMARRLVLLVDGLDEDKGATEDAEAYSIAALLPDRPAHGMRVLVSGRPNPQVPFDVADDHPLRHPGTERRLAPSRYAKAIRVDLQRELDRVLDGSSFEREILGLLVASGGGLTTADLGALTGNSANLREVRRALTGATGRTYRQRPGPYAGTGPGWELAHVELLRHARQEIGVAALDRFARRIHDWVGGYREAGWPATAPAYVLFEYARLLQDLSDAERLTTLAVDGRRHRLLNRATGSDYAAIQEVTMAQGLHWQRSPGPPAPHDRGTRHLVPPRDPRGRTPPDLAALGRLALARAMLLERNKALPSRLPALWLRLGHPDRADAMALSLSEPARSQAQSHLVRALGDLGNTAEAEDRAAAIADPFTRAVALADLAAHLGPGTAAQRASTAYQTAAVVLDDESRAIARLTVARRLASVDPASAREIASMADRSSDDIWSPYRKDAALVQLAGLVALLGDPGERVRSIVGKLHEPGDQAWAWRVVVEAYCATGEIVRARAALDDFLNLVPIIKWSQAHQLELASARAHARCAEALMRSGSASDRQAARRLASIALRAAKGVEDEEFRADGICEVLPAISQTGRPGLAERTAREIGFPEARCLALVALAQVARAENRALALLDAAAQAALTVEVIETRADLLARVAQTSLPLDRAKAEALAQQAEDTVRQADAAELRSGVLTAVATSLSRAGEGARAVAVARVVPNSFRQDELLAEVVQSLAEAGDPAGAEHVAFDMADSHFRKEALAAAAIGYGKRGMPGPAERAAAELGDEQYPTLVRVVRELARAGAWRDAERMALALIAPLHREAALAELATELSRADQKQVAAAIVKRVDFADLPVAAARFSCALAKHDPRTARLLLEVADREARALAHGEFRTGALEEVVRASIAVKDWTRARRAASDSPYGAGEAFALLVDGLLADGRTDEAWKVAGLINELPWRAAALAAIGVATPKPAHGTSALAQAFRAAHGATSYEKDRCIELVAAALAGRQAFGLAAKFGSTFASPYERRNALAPVFTGLAAAARWEEADEVLSQLTDRLRGEVVRESVRTIASAGSWGQAEQVTRAVAEPQLRAECQADLIKLNPTIEMDASVLADLLLGASWLSAVLALGAAQPAAAIAMHQALVVLGWCPAPPLDEEGP